MKAKEVKEKIKEFNKKIENLYEQFEEAKNERDDFVYEFISPVVKPGWYDYTDETGKYYVININSVYLSSQRCDKDTTIIAHGLCEEYVVKGIFKKRYKTMRSRYVNYNFDFSGKNIDKQRNAWRDTSFEVMIPFDCLTRRDDWNSNASGGFNPRYIKDDRK